MPDSISTRSLLEAIAKGPHRRDVVPVYSRAIRLMGDDTAWEKVNKAIADRWSCAGLRWIKTEAWREIQSFERGSS